MCKKFIYTFKKANKYGKIKKKISVQAMRSSQLLNIRFLIITHSKK